MIQRPPIVKDEHLDYLTLLRNSGETNMFGAAKYLQHAFGLNHADAKTIWVYWAESFKERKA